MLIGLVGTFVSDNSYENSHASILTMRHHDRSALRIRVALVARLTRAHRQMIDDSAYRVYATRARTRVDTALMRAHKIFGASLVALALGSAVRRASDEVGQTRARGLAADVATLRVGAAGRRVAGCLVELRWLGGD